MGLKKGDGNARQAWGTGAMPGKPTMPGLVVAAHGLLPGPYVA
jgi:hypothetical protein